LTPQSFFDKAFEDVFTCELLRFVDDHTLENLGEVCMKDPIRQKAVYLEMRRRLCGSNQQLDTIDRLYNFPSLALKWGPSPFPWTDLNIVYGTTESLKTEVFRTISFFRSCPGHLTHLTLQCGIPISEALFYELYNSLYSSGLQYLHLIDFQLIPSSLLLVPPEHPPSLDSVHTEGSTSSDKVLKNFFGNLNDITYARVDGPTNLSFGPSLTRARLSGGSLKDYSTFLRNNTGLHNLHLRNPTPGRGIRKNSIAFEDLPTRLEAPLDVLEALMPGAGSLGTLVRLQTYAGSNTKNGTFLRRLFKLIGSCDNLSHLTITVPSGSADSFYVQRVRPNLSVETLNIVFSPRYTVNDVKVSRCMNSGSISSRDSIARDAFLA
jgi:hypothetical protein